MFTITTFFHRLPCSAVIRPTIGNRSSWTIPRSPQNVSIPIKYPLCLKKWIFWVLRWKLISPFHYFSIQFSTPEESETISSKNEHTAQRISRLPKWNFHHYQVSIIVCVCVCGGLSGKMSRPPRRPFVWFSLPSWLFWYFFLSSDHSIDCSLVLCGLQLLPGTSDRKSSRSSGIGNCDKTSRMLWTIPITLQLPREEDQVEWDEQV